MRGDGIRYTLPAGWHAAAHSLTPHLVNPRELLTVGTGALPAGGRCAQFPSAALGAMRPRDVLLTVQERYGSTGSFPRRPSPFVLPPAEQTEAESCAGPHPAFASHWFEFRDGGRGFHVLVAVGRAAPRERVREAVAVLDSLRIARRRPVLINGDEALPYDKPGRGIQVFLPIGWRVYGQPLTQAISGRNQIALGTFPLHQRRPDTNCTPASAFRAMRPADGFIYMFEIDGLSRRTLDRVPPRPPRLRLPRSPQPYECMGPANWMVRFRDGGRAFQAHIYGPPKRRRDALAILDSMRIRPLR
jgi:hypothetical protein